MAQADVEASYAAHGRGSAGIGRYECSPLECEGTAAGAAGAGTGAGAGGGGPRRWRSWRNRVARAVAAAHPSVYVLPLGDLTAAGLADGHITSLNVKNGRPTSWGSECSHLCYSPGLTEAVAFLLLKAVQARDLGTPPAAVDWSPPG